jgi:hypothetical protein
MSYKAHIKRTAMHPSTRWIVKYNSHNKIIEIKQLFNPDEYRSFNPHKRKLYTQIELIKLLEE